MRWLISVFAVLLLTGCAFDDGEPWGRATFEMTVAFEVQAEHLTAEGHLLTDDGYRLELTQLDAHFGGVVLQQMASGAVEAGVFDPANPPAGYSMCHSGHCHADDGRLVDYADIAAEMGGDAPTEGPTVKRTVPEDVALSANAAPVVAILGDCTDDCAIGQGALEQVIVGLHGLRVVGRVFDHTDQGRLPAEGIALDHNLALSTHAVVPVEGMIGPDEPIGVAVSAQAVVSGALFNGVAWDQDQSSALSSALALTVDTNLKAGALALTVQLSRFE